MHFEFNAIILHLFCNSHKDEQGMAYIGLNRLFPSPLDSSLTQVQQYKSVSVRNSAEFALIQTIKKLNPFLEKFCKATLYTVELNVKNCALINIITYAFNLIYCMDSSILLVKF